MAVSSFRSDFDDIPLADDDPAVIIPEENVRHLPNKDQRKTDSMISSSSSAFDHSSDGVQFDDFESGSSPDEQEEKSRLIAQVLELQNTLDDLSQRVDGVKEENLKLKSENQVLGQYIENLMVASSVFQPTSTSSVTTSAGKAKK